MNMQALHVMIKLHRRYTHGKIEKITISFSNIFCQLLLNHIVREIIFATPKFVIITPQSLINILPLQWMPYHLPSLYDFNSCRSSRI